MLGRRGVAPLLAILLTALPAAPSAAAPAPAAPVAGRPAAIGTAEFWSDVADARRTVERYWTADFAARRRTLRPLSGVYYYVKPDDGRCGTAPMLPGNALYCAPGNFIAFDAAFLFAESRRIGDAFVYFVFGHEFGHAIQAQLGTTFRYPIAAELSADCYAGAYLGGSIRRGWLRVDKGDVDELAATLVAIGDRAGVAWLDPAAHGTPVQRARAFVRGYRPAAKGAAVPC